MLKLKLLLLAGGTFSLFGCCQVLGICTSASIHTSIPSQQQFVEQRGLQMPSPQFPVLTTPTDTGPMPELSEKKASLFDQIKAALEVHATIEEEIFYPAVKKARSEHLKDEVREGYEEHKQIKSLLAQISSITPADETYDMKIKVLKEDVEHHVKDEESEMFPDAKRFLGESRLAELGAHLEARKHQIENNFVSEPVVVNRSAARAVK